MIASNWKRGATLKKRLEQTVARHGLEKSLQWLGYPCLFALNCANSVGSPDHSFRTLMMQEMIARGALFQGLVYTTWSHGESEIDHLVTAFDESCAVYRKAIDAGSTAGLLVGPPAKPVFRRII